MNKVFKLIFNYSIKYVCELILIICLFLTFFQQIQESKHGNIIRGDGVGYYSYLPAVFIYQDFNYSFIDVVDKKYGNIGNADFFLKDTPNGKKVNKYYIGLSLLWLPFFLLAHILSFLFGFPTDGYSTLYQLSVVIATNFYLWLGCRYTRKLILKYSISDSGAAFVVILTVFATNLSHYVVFDSYATHTYSFALIAVFLFITHSFFQKNEIKKIYWMSFLLALIFLVRPTNILIVLIVLFFAENMQSFLNVIKTYKVVLLKGACVFFLTLTPQFILYYLQTNSFFVWSYGDEKFNFDNPEIMNVLFSYRKGLFVYAPITMLSLFGLFYIFKKNKFQMVVLLLFFLISSYIISSWWCWYYGMCLGQRSFIDYYVLVALLLTFLYLSIRKTYIKMLFYAICSFCIIFSSVLSYQYRHYIIHWDSMTKQKFWFVFMRTDETYEGLVWSDTFFLENKTPHLVSLKTSHNNFLRAEPSGTEFIFTNSEKGKSWETFNMINLDNYKIALQTDNGKYVSARLDDENVLKHIAEKIDRWEMFELIHIENDKIALKAFNDKYAIVKDGKVFLTASSLCDAERFELIEK